MNGTGEHATRTVAYQYGTYSGTVAVRCDSNADNDEIVAAAKQLLRRRGDYGFLSMAYESFKVKP